MEYPARGFRVTAPPVPPESLAERWRDFYHSHRREIFMGLLATLTASVFIRMTQPFWTAFCGKFLPATSARSIRLAGGLFESAGMGGGSHRKTSITKESISTDRLAMISDWNYPPTPFWGAMAKKALAGKQFVMKKTR